MTDGTVMPLQRGAKRVVDVVGSVFLLLLLMPLMVVIAAVIKLDSPGPALFVQRRAGRGGRQFRMYKFRSMCQGAETMLAQLAHKSVGGTHLVRIPDDPRVTRMGAVLRCSSLDELPQLLNVLKGEMSLVGPRPLHPEHVARYTPEQHRRLAVQPGMTGLWQVTSRDDPSFDECVRLDLLYVGRWNLWLDLAILLRTPAAVVRGVRASHGRTGRFAPGRDGTLGPVHVRGQASGTKE
jgi:lipopolysaccharide/colanic/teichoic acid biosynthesis glycosyltransferase